MVIYVLSFGPQRTGKLQRAMPGISKKLLTQTLRELERDGLVKREVFRVVPPMVEYSLTGLGIALAEPLLMLYEWAENHSELLDQLEANVASSDEVKVFEDTMGAPLSVT